MKRINWRASPLHAAVMGVCNSMVQVVSAFGIHMNGSQDAAITGILNSLLICGSQLLIAVSNGNGRAAQ